MIFSFLKNLSTLSSSSSFAILLFFNSLTGVFRFSSKIFSLVFHMLETRNRLSSKLFHSLFLLLLKKDTRAYIHIQIQNIYVQSKSFDMVFICTRACLFFRFRFFFAHFFSLSLCMCFVSHTYASSTFQLNKLLVYSNPVNEMEKRKIENELKRLYSVVCLFVWKCCLKTSINNNNNNDTR